MIDAKTYWTEALRKLAERRKNTSDWSTLEKLAELEDFARTCLVLNGQSPVQVENDFLECDVD